jgi:hypothetical protein
MRKLLLMLSTALGMAISVEAAARNPLNHPLFIPVTTIERVKQLVQETPLPEGKIFDLLAPHYPVLDQAYKRMLALSSGAAACEREMQICRSLEEGLPSMYLLEARDLFHNAASIFDALFMEITIFLQKRPLMHAPWELDEVLHLLAES